MELNEGVPVYLADGQPAGRLERLVIDPKTRRVSHFVLSSGRGEEARVLSTRLIQSATPEGVHLAELPCTLADLPAYEVTHYVLTDERDLLEHETYQNAAIPAMYWYPPVNVSAGLDYVGLPGAGIPAGQQIQANEPAYTTQTKRNVPAGSVVLQEGADVLSRDGRKVGKVEKLFFDQQNRRITHFLVSRGFLLKTERLIPEGWISQVEEDHVTLGVGAGDLEKLPEYTG